MKRGFKKDYFTHQKLPTGEISEREKSGVINADAEPPSILMASAIFKSYSSFSVEIILGKADNVGPRNTLFGL